MKTLFTLVTALALPLILLAGADAQERIAEAQAAEAEPAMCVVPDDGGSVQMSLNGADYTCFPNSTGDTERMLTSCYCGEHHGEQIYFGVDCSGYAGTQTCCADKCGQLMSILDTMY